VAPLLFIMLFGIIDYGIWFADSIGMRQGVREAARRVFGDGKMLVVVAGRPTARIPDVVRPPRLPPRPGRDHCGVGP